MASSSSSSPLLQFTLFFLISFFTNPSSSATSTKCSNHKFSNNRVFETCSDLPHLNSSLHWSYDPAKSSFSLAFLAPPPSPTGWIAWAINPTSKGMLGAQSIIAFRLPNGSMTVRTFNIRSYVNITPSPISIKVTDLEGELSNGVMTIFATVAVPGNATTLNQVWQVGPSVTGGVPNPHDMKPDNLEAMGALDLLRGVKKEHQQPPPPPQQQSIAATSGGEKNRSSNRAVFLLFLLHCWSLGSSM